jgi:hypothetical protein
MTERNASPRLKTAPRDGTTKAPDIVGTAAEVFKLLVPMIEDLVAEKVGETLKARDDQDQITLDQMFLEVEFEGTVVVVPDFGRSATVVHWREFMADWKKIIASYQLRCDTVEEAIEQAWIEFSEDAALDAEANA